MCPSASSDCPRVRAAARLVVAIWGGAALAGATSCASAQTNLTRASLSEETLALLAPVPLSAKNPLLRPHRDYQGVPLADWLLYPSVSLGAVYDDNLGWAPRHPRRAAGFRVAPSIAAERDVDGHRLALFADGDARFYPTVPKAQSIDGAVGGAYQWRVTPELTVKASAKYAHASLPVGSGLAQTPAGVTTLVSPLVTDKGEASLAVQKAFGRAFVGLSLDSAKMVFSPLDTASGRISQSYRDSWVNTVTARGGVWIGPTIYAFGEAAGNKRDYTNSPYGSKGYRAVAGLGSDRISLFRGEIYVGAQRQIYDAAARWSASSPVLGGKLFWYPLRTLTVRASLDETFTDSSLPTPGNPLGAPARATNAELSVQHQITRDILIAWRLGYEVERYLRTVRTDRILRAGVGLSYSPRRNLDVTLDYEYSRAASSEATAGFHRNVANAGLKYRF